MAGRIQVDKARLQGKLCTGVGLRCTQSLNGALHSLSPREPSVASAVLSSASRLLMLSLRRLWDVISCDTQLRFELSE